MTIAEGVFPGEVHGARPVFVCGVDLAAPQLCRDVGEQARAGGGYAGLWRGELRLDIDLLRTGGGKQGEDNGGQYTQDPGGGAPTRSRGNQRPGGQGCAVDSVWGAELLSSFRCTLAVLSCRLTLAPTKLQSHGFPQM